LSERGSYIGFGAYKIDPSTAQLFRGGKKISIQDKPFRILMILLQRPGEVVSREELCRTLWPDTNVELDLCLNTAVHKLRLALDDHATKPRFIATFGVNGYCFIGRLRSAIRANAQSQTALRPFRLAVIPFEDLKPDGREYFAYSMTEQVIARLGSSKQFTLCTPALMVHYKHASKAIPQLCRELHSDYLLCGAALRNGSRFRLYVRLVNGHDQSCMWTKAYTSDEADILETQDMIAGDIVEGISTVLASPANRGSRPLGHASLEKSPAISSECIGSDPASDDDVIEPSLLEPVNQ
jgi:TolB-like protein